MSYEMKELEDGFYARNTEEDVELNILLSDDEDVALRVFALRTFLDEWGQPLDYLLNNMFGVNPHVFVKYITNDAEYLVLTDDEADDRWDEELDNYIDNCMEIPKAVMPYFDRESWKRDARMDGRGHAISSYDGRENRVDVEDANGDEHTFYIFRMN